MNADILGLQSIGVAMVLFATVALLLMVHFELGPAARLTGGAKLLLAGALGIGVIAFTIKLGIIATVTGVPEQVIAPLIAAKPPGPDPAPEPMPEPRDYVWQALPATAPAPADNPTTPAKIALGKRLFHDSNLSRDRKLSCASCHDLTKAAGADGRPVAIGIGGAQGGRNSPTVLNAAFQAVLFWDGRAASLEEQAKGPLVNPIEMGMPSLKEVEQRVRDEPSYWAAFADAFGPDTAITIERIAQAIAAFERTLITADSPYDRFVSGDAAALSPAQLRGMARFQSLGCVTCHAGANFSAASLLTRTGIPLRRFPANASEYDARYRLTEDGGKTHGPGPGVWRIPSLRNVALTGPYFHNGSVADLKEAVRIMVVAQSNRVLGDAPRVDLTWSAGEGILREVTRQSVSDAEINDIVAFLEALTSDRLRARNLAGR